MPLILREVCLVRVDGRTQIKGRDISSCGQEYFGKSSGAAAGFEDVGSLTAVQHVPTRFPQAPARSVSRDRCLGIRIQLRLPINIPLKAKSGGVVIWLRDHSRNARIVSPAVTLRAHELSLCRGEGFSVIRADDFRPHVGDSAA